jgi:hypothetical protein
MLLKDGICTFEELQDQSRSLMDGLIGKDSVGIEKIKYFLLIFSVAYFSSR